MGNLFAIHRRLILSVSLFLIAVLMSSSLHAYGTAAEHQNEAGDILSVLNNDSLDKQGKKLRQSFFNSIAEMDTKGYNKFRSDALKLFGENSTIGKNLTQGYGHRIFFHWGAGGKIPFNVKGHPINSYIAKLKAQRCTQKEIADFKRLVADSWRGQRNKSFQKAEKFLEYIKVSAPKTMAKPFASLTYDIHILGDYSSPMTGGLPPLRSLKNDVVKQIGKLFGSEIAREFKKEIGKISAENVKVGAGQILSLLKDRLPQYIDQSPRFPPTAKKILRLSLAAVSGSASIIRLMKEIDSTFEKIPGANLRQAVKTGVFFGLVSAGWNCYKFSTGQIEALEAVKNTFETTATTTASMYIANALIQRVPQEIAIKTGEKYAISAICQTGAAQFGLATFIYNQTDSVYKMISGEISLNQFTQQTVDNAAIGAATTLAVQCSVLLGATPGGFVVLAVVFASNMAVNYGISEFRDYQEEDYLFVEDILPFLPISVEQRETFWNPKQRETFFEPKSRETFFNPKSRETFFEPEQRKTFFNPR